MGKSNIKLWQLLDVIDYNRESEIEKIQICRPNSDFDDFDEVLTSSSILVPFYSATVYCIQAVGENIIRVDIDWNELPFFKMNRESGWGRENE